MNSEQCTQNLHTVRFIIIIKLTSGVKEENKKLNEPLLSKLVFLSKHFPFLLPSFIVFDMLKSVLATSHTACVVIYNACTLSAHY